MPADAMVIVAFMNLGLGRCRFDLDIERACVSRLNAGKLLGKSAAGVSRPSTLVRADRNWTEQYRHPPGK